MLLLMATACHQRNSSGQPDPASSASSDTAVKLSDTAQKNFLPVAGYLRTEISYVDSTPLAILKYTIQGNRTDSSFIPPAQFDQFAREFLMPELAQADLEKNYVESSFQDETTGYLTFSYAPRDRNLPLQRIDVLTTPDKGSNKVSSIFLERITRIADTLVTKKMYWKAGHSFLVITSLQSSKKDPVVRQTKVVWNAE
jgi:hypothetical protein